MNIVIGTAAGIGGMLLSDEILARNLPIDGGIFRILFAPIHPVVGGLYALAATGSTPLLSCAALTAGVLIMFDMDDSHAYHHRYETGGPPLRPIKNALRHLAAYLASVGLNVITSFVSTKTTTTVATKESADDKSPSKTADRPGFIASLAVDSIIKSAISDESTDDEIEYVFC